MEEKTNGKKGSLEQDQINWYYNGVYFKSSILFKSVLSLFFIISITHFHPQNLWLEATFDIQAALKLLAHRRDLSQRLARSLARYLVIINAHNNAISEVSASAAICSH